MFSKLLLVSLLVFSFNSFAEDKKTDWKPCEKEMKEFGCKADGTDKEIWECLEKHDDKLSKRCQVPHNINDKKFGK
jgi:hypothetical protein